MPGSPSLPPRYADAAPVARGGMGEVVRAVDRELGREVAVKVLGAEFANDHAVRRRFTREALAAARLSGHPHIVMIYDVGEWHGRPFIVMEYLAGGTLADRIWPGPVAPERALRWLGEAADAVDAAHALGVVHRDLKPANLLFDGRGALRVADFGIARVADDTTLEMTAVGTIIGTAGYLSPEQAAGRPATPASDVYSLGVVAFELLTGRRPFERASQASEAAAHVAERPPAASSIRPELPPAVDAVLAGAMAKAPEDRPASAAALVRDLGAALRPAPAATVPLPRPPAPVPAARRRRLPILAAAFILAAGAAGYTALDGDGDRGSAAPDRRGPRAGTEGKQTPAAVKADVPSEAEALDLNDRAYELMNAGEDAAALPLLRRAVAGLRHSDRIEAAYADYNLGVTLLRLGRCGAALPPLRRSAAAQPIRPEPVVAIAVAEACHGIGTARGAFDDWDAW